MILPYRYQHPDCGVLSEESAVGHDGMTTIGTVGCFSQESATLENQLPGKRQLGSWGLTQRVGNKPKTQLAD